MKTIICLACPVQSIMAVFMCHLYQAVIHRFAREMLAGGGRMILGSDSHTRYGALGTMAVGEGGPEIVKTASFPDL